jgi:SOS-response transcriptional repressor LexA
MGWADNYLERLLAGETVQFRPTGNSMNGKINSGQLVTVSPVPDLDSLEVGQIVLCEVRGHQYLHLIDAKRDGQFLIANNRGYKNGWTTTIYGRVTKVE